MGWGQPHSPRVPRQQPPPQRSFPELLAEKPGGTIEQRFQSFHEANGWVYDELVRLARQLRGRGHRRLGIGMLWEVIRWRYMAETLDPASDFHLNDHYRSRYARLIMEREADLDGVFEVRRLRTA